VWNDKPFVLSGSIYIPLIHYKCTCDFIFLTKHHAMKAYLGSGCVAPCIPDLGTRWRWVVSFTSRPLYPQGKSPWYPLDRKLGGARNRVYMGLKFSRTLWGKNIDWGFKVVKVSENPQKHPALYSRSAGYVKDEKMGKWRKWPKEDLNLKSHILLLL
jgi:hypothetical protein